MFSYIKEAGVRVNLHRRPQGLSSAAIYIPLTTEITIFRNNTMIGATAERVPIKQKPQTTENSTQTDIIGLQKPLPQLYIKPIFLHPQVLGKMGCFVTAAFDKYKTLQMHLTIPEDLEVLVFRKNNPKVLIDTFYTEEKKLNPGKSTVSDECTQTELSIPSYPLRIQKRKQPIVSFHEPVRTTGIAEIETYGPAPKILLPTEPVEQFRCYSCSQILKTLSRTIPTNTFMKCPDHKEWYACETIRKKRLVAIHPTKEHELERRLRNKIIPGAPELYENSNFYQKLKTFVAKPKRTRNAARKTHQFTKSKTVHDPRVETLETFVERINNKRKVRVPLKRALALQELEQRIADQVTASHHEQIRQRKIDELARARAQLDEPELIMISSTLLCTFRVTLTM